MWLWSYICSCGKLFKIDILFLDFEIDCLVAIYILTTVRFVRLSDEDGQSFSGGNGY